MASVESGLRFLRLLLNNVSHSCNKLLLTKESFESCKIQVFCIAEEDADAAGLKADVKKFLYDLRMQAEVIVISMKSWDGHAKQQDESVEAFTAAQRRVASYMAEMKERKYAFDG
ncbi:hypothetical protein Leryth_000181 [Lithospermum erythrorhizon]|nr:hypothetical protein Leryth_000181 [Lithospermum erythrorhizon]